MFLYLSKLLPLFIYPLGLAIVLCLTTVVLIWWRKPRLAVFAALFAVFELWLFSVPLVSSALLWSLDGQHPPIAAEQSRSAEAIVVLGGSLHLPNSLRKGVELAESSDRILHAAHLWKAGKAPLVLMSGGNIEFFTNPSDPPEAQWMAALAREFGVPAGAILTETRSRNTFENAELTARILNPRGVRRILLVTSGFHMPRSVAIFRKVGFEVIPATTDILAGDTQGDLILRLLPSVDALQASTLALKEWVGLVVYRLRGWA